MLCNALVTTLGLLLSTWPAKVEPGYSASKEGRVVGSNSNLPARRQASGDLVQVIRISDSKHPVTPHNSSEVPGGLQDVPQVLQVGVGRADPSFWSNKDWPCATGTTGAWSGRSERINCSQTCQAGASVSGGAGERCRLT
jgi:hypothetical protein